MIIISGNCTEVTLSGKDGDTNSQEWDSEINNKKGTFHRNFYKNPGPILPKYKILFIRF